MLVKNIKLRYTLYVLIFYKIKVPAQVAEQVDAQDLGPLRPLSTKKEMTCVNSSKFGETLQITLLAIPSQRFAEGYEIK